MIPALALMRTWEYGMSPYAAALEQHLFDGELALLGSDLPSRCASHFP